jgi:hypothetical protein
MAEELNAEIAIEFDSLQQVVNELDALRYEDSKENPADPYMTVLGYFNSLRELGGARRIPEALFGFVGSGLRQRARGAERHRAFHRGFVCVCGTAMAATAVTAVLASCWIN